METFIVHSSHNEGNELKHHGILGQRWGVRRFQNEDGTRTPAGKKRQVMRYRKDFKKDVQNKSDSDIDGMITRLKKEREVKNLLFENAHPYINSGKQFISTVGGKVLTAATVGALAYAGKAYVSSKSNDKGFVGNINLQEAAGYMFPNPNKKK